MTKSKKQRLGQLPPQYNFSLNPYPDLRFSSCPDCGRKTGQRKLPLLIHIGPFHLIALNYTCKYCRHCEMLIAHKDDEHLLTTMFAQYDPSVIGNAYLIVGTVEKKAWREGLTQSKSVADMLPHTHDFKSYQEIRMSKGGWFHVDQEPPERNCPIRSAQIRPTQSAQIPLC